MTRNPPQRLAGGAVLWLFAVAAACDSSSPATLPTDHPGYRHPPPPPELVSLGDERVTAECRTASVSVRARREVQPVSSCREPWIFDFSIESDAGEAMLVDFLRPYGFYDWRVHAGGGRVRHDFSVTWDPYDYFFATSGSRGGLRPMTLRICPEGERGPVLACSDVSCELYEREEDVPEVLPSSLDFSLRSPWGFEDIQELYEGETLEIPLTYVVHGDEHHRSGRLAMTLYPEISEEQRSYPPRSDDDFYSGDYSSAFDVSPQRIELGNLRRGDSGTAVFRLTARSNDVEQTPSLYWVIFRAFGPHYEECVAKANNIQVWVHDRP